MHYNNICGVIAEQLSSLSVASFIAAYTLPYVAFSADRGGFRVYGCDVVI